MKKRTEKVLGLVGVLIVFMKICTACSSSSNDWPDTDEMIKNLQNKDYTITEDSKIQIEEIDYSGSVIIATKGSDFVAGFWAEDTNAAEAVYDYWGTKYQSDHTLRVGTTVYCGTKRAIKHAGINLR